MMENMHKINIRVVKEDRPMTMFGAFIHVMFSVYMLDCAHMDVE